MSWRLPAFILPLLFAVLVPLFVHAGVTLEADLMCIPVIRECGCGQLKNKKTGECEKKGEIANMWQCRCYDNPGGKIVEGKCVAGNNCEGTRFQNQKGEWENIDPSKPTPPEWNQQPQIPPSQQPSQPDSSPRGTPLQETPGSPPARSIFEDFPLTPERPTLPDTASELQKMFESGEIPIETRGVPLEYNPETGQFTPETVEALKAQMDGSAQQFNESQGGFGEKPALYQDTFFNSDQFVSAGEGEKTWWEKAWDAAQASGEWLGEKIADAGKSAEKAFDDFLRDLRAMRDPDLAKGTEGKIPRDVIEQEAGRPIPLAKEAPVESPQRGDFSGKGSEVSPNLGEKQASLITNFNDISGGVPAAQGFDESGFEIAYGGDQPERGPSGAGPDSGGDYQSPPDTGLVGNQPEAGFENDLGGNKPDEGFENAGGDEEKPCGIACQAQRIACAFVGGCEGDQPTPTPSIGDEVARQKAESETKPQVEEAGQAAYYDSRGCGAYGLGRGGTCAGGNPLRPGDVAVPRGSGFKPNEEITATFCGPRGCQTYSMRVHDLCESCKAKGYEIDVWGREMRSRIERDTGLSFSRAGEVPVTVQRSQPSIAASGPSDAAAGYGPPAGSAQAYYDAFGSSYSTQDAASAADAGIQAGEYYAAFEQGANTPYSPVQFNADLISITPPAGGSLAFEPGVDEGFNAPRWMQDVGFSGYSPPWEADVGFTGPPGPQPIDWSAYADSDVLSYDGSKAQPYLPSENEGLAFERSIYDYPNTDALTYGFGPLDQELDNAFRDFDQAQAAYDEAQRAGIAARDRVVAAERDLEEAENDPGDNAVEDAKERLREEDESAEKAFDELQKAKADLADKTQKLVDAAQKSEDARAIDDLNREGLAAYKEEKNIWQQTLDQFDKWFGGPPEPPPGFADMEDFGDAPTREAAAEAALAAAERRVNDALEDLNAAIQRDAPDAERDAIAERVQRAGDDLWSARRDLAAFQEQALAEADAERKRQAEEIATKERAAAQSKVTPRSVQIQPITVKPQETPQSGSKVSGISPDSPASDSAVKPPGADCQTISCWNKEQGTPFMSYKERAGDFDVLVPPGSTEKYIGSEEQNGRLLDLYKRENEERYNPSPEARVAYEASQSPSPDSREIDRLTRDAEATNFMGYLREQAAGFGIIARETMDKLVSDLGFGAEPPQPVSQGPEDLNPPEESQPTGPKIETVPVRQVRIGEENPYFDPLRDPGGLGPLLGQPEVPVRPVQTTDPQTPLSPEDLRQAGERGYEIQQEQAREVAQRNVDDARAARDEAQRNAEELRAWAQDVFDRTSDRNPDSSEAKAAAETETKALDALETAEKNLRDAEDALKKYPPTEAQRQAREAEQNLERDLSLWERLGQQEITEWPKTISQLAGDLFDRNPYDPGDLPNFPGSGAEPQQAAQPSPLAGDEENLSTQEERQSALEEYNKNQREEWDRWRLDDEQAAERSQEAGATERLAQEAAAKAEADKVAAAEKVAPTQAEAAKAAAEKAADPKRTEQQEKTNQTVETLSTLNQEAASVANRKFRDPTEAKDAAKEATNDFKSEARKLLNDPTLTQAEKAEVQKKIAQMDTNLSKISRALDAAATDPQRAAILAGVKGARDWGFFNYPSEATQAAAKRAFTSYVRSLGRANVTLGNQIITIGVRAANR